MPYLSFRHAKITLVLTAVLGSFVPSHADKIVFPREFAPSEGPVADLEKPSRDAMCLNGSWQFQPQDVPADYVKDSGNAPELTPPAADRWDPVAIKIPSPWNINAFSPSKGLGPDFHNYPSYPESWEKVEMGWMRRTFRVPDAWAGKRLVLHFGAVAGKAQVLINGKKVGDHFDLFLPFDFDITDLVKPGVDNEVLVGVQKASLFDKKGPHGRGDYQVGSMWGLNVIGIWQDVFLEALPALRIDNVFVQPKVGADQLTTQVVLKNDTDSDVNVSLGGAVRSWHNDAGTDTLSAPEPKWSLATDTSLALPDTTTGIPAHGTKTITLDQKVGGKLNLWSPDQPNLYGLVLTLNQADGKAADVKYTRFGWREFTIKGRDTFLNGQPVVFKGDAWHFMGIPELTRRYAWAWDKMLKEGGGNTLRLHAEPYPPFFLDVADEMGVMILDETAVYGSNGVSNYDSPAFWADADREVRELVLRDRDHPCVMGWSVCNEIHAFIVGVYHSPPEIMPVLKKHYGIWAATCRELDPTHPWMSADGDLDGMGELPVINNHYVGPDYMKQSSQGDKPWAVGETGGGYFASPQQAARFNGERAYQSIEGLKEGVGLEAQQSLADMDKYSGNYRSVFNMAWYGLQPLPFGHADTSKAPTPDEGIFFGPYAENKPGVQPERLGPYSSTFNPGYDPNLPLYKTWALWEGISDGFTGKPAPDAWKQATAAATPAPAVPVPPAKAIAVLGGTGGKLGPTLAREGVALVTGDDVPDLLFIDGLTPPDASAKAKMDAVTARGGTVFVWGVSSASLPALNTLLPAPLELSAREASSLLPVGNDPLIAGIKPSDLYFCESEPTTILDAGLDGDLVTKGTSLLKAPEVDWLRWISKGEDIKTASVLRSQLEAKPSGVAMLAVPQGSGRLVVCNLPTRGINPKRQALIEKLLANLGVTISKQNVSTDIIDVDGELTRGLVCGAFPVESFAKGVAASFVDPTAGASFHAGADAGQDRKWAPFDKNGTLFDFKKPALPGPSDNAVCYLSFWVFSPRSLDNLLVEPNIPKLDLIAYADDGGEVWLNGKSIAKKPYPGPIEGGKMVASGLPLQKGWNHFLVKVIQATGQWQFKATFQCDQPDFLNQLHSAIEKPSGE